MSVKYCSWIICKRKKKRNIVALLTFCQIAVDMFLQFEINTWYLPRQVDIKELRLLYYISSWLMESERMKTKSRRVTLWIAPAIPSSHANIVHQLPYRICLSV